MERKKSVTVILEYLTMFTVEILCGQLLQGLANKDRRKRELWTSEILRREIK